MQTGKQFAEADSACRWTVLGADTSFPFTVILLVWWYLLPLVPVSYPFHYAHFLFRVFCTTAYGKRCSSVEAFFLALLLNPVSRLQCLVFCFLNIFLKLLFWDFLFICGTVRWENTLGTMCCSQISMIMQKDHDAWKKTVFCVIQTFLRAETLFSPCYVCSC